MRNIYFSPSFLPHLSPRRTSHSQCPAPSATSSIFHSPALSLILSFLFTPSHSHSPSFYSLSLILSLSVSFYLSLSLFPSIHSIPFSLSFFLFTLSLSSSPPCEIQPVHPVLEYTKATGLQPILLALGGEDRYVE